MDQTQEIAVVRGLPVSGRNWKNLELAKKASNRTTTKAMRRSFESRMQLASNQKAIKTTVKEMKEERLAEKIKMVEIRKLKEEKRIENEKKAEVVQIISNVRKLKRLNKKKLRNIEKRDKM